jgi:hypothetical protein
MTQPEIVDNQEPEVIDNQGLDGRKYLLMGGYILGSVLELKGVGLAFGGAESQVVLRSVLEGAVVLAGTEFARRIT